MHSEYFLLFLINTLSLEACCVGNHRNKRTGPQQNTSHQRYKTVEGEIFMLPCLNGADQQIKVCSRNQNSSEKIEKPSFHCGREFVAEEKHAGNYTCLTRGSQFFLHLQVVKTKSLGCYDEEESKVALCVGRGSEIQCPGLNCSDNTGVIWYKGSKPVSEQPRDLCEGNGLLHLCEVNEFDTGVYFCDRQVIEHGFKWSFRRAVNVTAVPYFTPSYSPRITYPEGSMEEEVEPGLSHTLTCKVYFPFEMNFSPKVRWYMHYGGNMENMTLLHMEKQQQERFTFQEYEVRGKALIEQVTQQHLNNTFTCIATNSVGNSSVTIRLKKKIKANWPSIVGYPVASLLLVSLTVIILHRKWLELQLIYKSHFQHGKHDGDEKEFDVFLSFVWSAASANTEGLLTFSPRSGPDTDKEAYLSSMHPLRSAEGEVTQRALEEMLPQVLEEQWGYRVCLLERDVLPGGAYTNDVVLTVQKCKMLICLLSVDYLSNSNAVFVLESGVQALLQNSTPKLLLIWTSKASASVIQTDPPLPAVVQRALKVLPHLNWTSEEPDTRDFWRSLKKAMPDLRNTDTSEQRKYSVTKNIS